MLMLPIPGFGHYSLQEPRLLFAAYGPPGQRSLKLGLFPPQEWPNHFAIEMVYSPRHPKRARDRRDFLIPIVYCAIGGLRAHG